MGKQLHSTAKILALAVLLAAPSFAGAQTVTAIPKLNLSRLAGTWFEQDHLPNKTESKCVSDATVLYALADKPTRLQIVATCTLKDGFTNVRNKEAKLANKSGDGKLKVAGLFPLFLFAQKLWVIATGPDYEWLLVGSPNHKNLYILSKAQTLPPETLADIRSRASAQGFPVAKLVQIPPAQ